MDRFRWRHAAVLTLVSCATVLVLAGTASAHATLVTTNPVANSVLTTSPPKILLTFSERVNILDDSIRVVTGTGDEVQTGTARHDGGANTISVTLPRLDDGTYVVAWKAISADSHPVSGAFVFSVGAPSATAPGLVQDLLNSSKSPQGDRLALGLGRVLGFGGMALLIGGLTIAVTCAISLLPGRRIGSLLWTGLGLGAAGTALMIAAQAAGSVGSWTSWSSVLHTDAGRWWFARLGALIVAALIVASRRQSPQWWWRIAAVVVAVGLITFTAAGGHGLTGDMVVLGYLATCVHLGAMSLWVGGIGVLACAGRERLLSVAGRFSPIALGSVAALAATGVVNAWRQSSSFSALIDSSYGRWLLVKVIVVTLIVAIAAISRRLTHTTDAPADARVGRLRRTVALEAAGMVVVLVVTAGLVSSAPPRAASAQTVVTVDVVQDTRIAQITLDPAVSGGTTMHVYITSAAGSLEQPTEVKVSALLPAQGLGPIDLPLQTAGPGHLTGSGINFPFPGIWTITVIARYGDFDATTFSTRIEVR